jgi:hypothetical protein
MPISNYPFQKKGNLPLRSPILPIRIVNPSNGFEYKTWGLIDTGAFDSAIPEHIAKTLGYDICSVKPTDGLGAGGCLQAYPHTFKIDFFEMSGEGIVNSNKIVHTISKRYIGVIQKLPYVLLGVKEFLGKFVLIIDYKDKRVSVKHPKGIVKDKSSLTIHF